MSTRKPRTPKTLTPEKVEELQDKLLSVMARLDGAELDKLCGNVRELQELRERLEREREGVIDLGTRRLQRAREEHAAAANRLLDMAIRRRRPSIAVADVDALIDRLLDDLAELEILRRRLLEEH